MARKICLMSGHASKRELEAIDSRMLAEAGSKNVLVLNLSLEDAEKLKQKEEFLGPYFKTLGADNVSFVSPTTSRDEARARFKHAGLTYLPGGETETFIRNIREMGLEVLISSFAGIISANSAGAYALCPEYLKLRDGNVEIISATSIVPFWIKAHYIPEFDSILTELSDDREIYGLSDCSAVIWRGGLNYDFVGDVTRFEWGEREKVN